eukprot:Skav225997  [mRNA]  locus=scaffold4003:267268:267648:+ [translate_table: standard]
MLRVGFHGFQRAMIRWPLATTMANTSVLWVVSDSVSQSVAPTCTAAPDEKQNHDWARTARMVSYGAFFYAGLALKWYATQMHLWMFVLSLDSDLCGIEGLCVAESYCLVSEIKSIRDGNANAKQSA